MKKGFTLVELSIVLVIIGLLIGGILVAQSMIGTAKIQSSIKQLLQYQIAVTNFQTKYSSLPGDNRVFHNLGDNNGLIDWNNGPESYYFWSDLSQGVNLKTAKGGDYIAYDFDNNIDLVNGVSHPVDIDCSPVLAIPNNSNGKSYMIGVGNVLTGKNVFSYGSMVGGYSFNGTVPPLRSIDLLSIDQKIDDGKPLTGKLVCLSTCYTGISPNDQYKSTGGYNAYFSIEME